MIGDAQPLVSVVIPTYNRAGFVTEAIDSVLAQTMQDVEIIIVDDGSTDDTRGTLARYDGRIRYVFQENSGPACARNRGVAVSRGRYIAFLDSDDLWLPEKLETQLAYLWVHPEIALVFTEVERVERDGTRRASRFRRYRPRDGDVLEETVSHPCIATQSMLLKREVLDVVQFDETLLTGEGLDFVIRLALRFPIGLVDRPLTLIRKHEANLDRSWDASCAKDVDVKYQAFFVDFDRICEKEPDLRGRYRHVVRRALGTVYRDWGLALDDAGRGREARAKLVDSLKLRPRLGTMGQLVKTFVPEWLRACLGAKPAGGAAGTPRPT